MRILSEHENSPEPLVPSAGSRAATTRLWGTRIKFQKCWCRGPWFSQVLRCPPYEHQEDRDLAMLIVVQGFPRSPQSKAVCSRSALGHLVY